MQVQLRLGRLSFASPVERLGDCDAVEPQLSLRSKLSRTVRPHCSLCRNLVCTSFRHRDFPTADPVLSLDEKEMVFGRRVASWYHCAVEVVNLIRA